jgi:ATP-dependent RNA helicase DeaD
VDSVQQKFVRIDEGGKFSTLRALLNQEHITKGLIFCETKARAGALAQVLQDEHYKAVALHSDLSQFQRDSAVHSFRIGLTNLLVATEVAARGLDIPKVSHVVNYDMPDEPKMYFHRIGRTARAGKPGVAVSLVTRQDEDGFKRIRKMTSSDLREFPDGLLPENRTGSKFLLPTRPSQGATLRSSSGRRPRRYNRRERSFRRNRRR